MSLLLKCAQPNHHLESNCTFSCYNESSTKMLPQCEASKKEEPNEQNTLIHFREPNSDTSCVQPTSENSLCVEVGDYIPSDLMMPFTQRTEHDHMRRMHLTFTDLHYTIPTSTRQKSSLPSSPAKLKHAWRYAWGKRNELHCKSSINDECVKLEQPTSRSILSSIDGYAKAGEVLAIMGPSGSGKTTLLNILSGRLKADNGLVKMNGQALDKLTRRKMGYVLQSDIFFPGLTLKQTLVYTAMLRLPETMSKTKKLQHVQKLIKLLDLTQCENTIIGDIMTRGLSGGEKKRANIACELLTNPTVMLLDEPTSGLDSSSAYSLMQTLKCLAVRDGKTIITSVHQPSSQIFYLFDRLLLLANGRLAYFGSGQQVMPFFSKLGYTCVPHYNPADLMVEKARLPSAELARIVAAARHLCKHLPLCEQNFLQSGECANLSTCCSCKLSQTLADTDSGRSSWTDGHSSASFCSNRSCCSTACSREDVYADSEHGDVCDIKNRAEYSCLAKNQNEFICDSKHIPEYPRDNRNELSNTVSSTLNEGYDSRWPTRFHTQVHVLTRRNFYEARSRLLCSLNWLQTIGLAVLAGLLWSSLPRSEQTLTDLDGYLFFSCSYWMLFAWFAALISIPPERAVVNKERASGAYRLSAFYLAKMAGELPLVIALPSLYFLLSFLFVTYNHWYWSQILAHWACMVISSLVSQSIGLFVALAAQDMQLSVTVSAIYSSAINLFAGYYSRCLPTSLSWLRYSSLLHYAFQNMQIVEYTLGAGIKCSPKQSRFEFCLKNNTSEAFIPQEELLKSIGAKNHTFWINIGVLFSFLFAFRLFGYLVLKYVHRPK